MENYIYDEVLDILREYDVTISLGDALRPGCIDDSSDAGRITELIKLGNLTKRAWEKDVQVMVEGPGHMAMDEIAANMKMQKRICHNAPFYVLNRLSQMWHRDTIISHLQSEALVLCRQQAALISFAMLHRQSICAFRFRGRKRRNYRIRKSRHTRRILQRAFQMQEHGTMRWRRQDIK